MRIIGIFLLLLSPLSFANEYPACNISKDKAVSFQSYDSKDRLEVSVIGSPCYEAKFKIRVVSNYGKTLYEYNSTFKQHNSINWADPDLNKDAEKHVNYILENAMTSSSTLPDVFPCEVQEPGCEPYEKNTVSIEEYRTIKKNNVPMLNHSTFYEGWASFIFSSEIKKTIKVLEGGV